MAHPVNRTGTSAWTDTPGDDTRQQQHGMSTATNSEVQQWLA